MRKSLITTAVLVALAPPAMVFAEDAAPAAPAGPTLMQGMNFPLANNPNPLSVDAGPLGKVYISGALSGIGLTQSNSTNNNQFSQHEKSNYVDITNAQIILQKADGLVQFYVQGGSYSAPTLGVPYVRSSTITDKSFGNIPVAYVKLAPTDNFSIQAGKLPTLIGTEYAFTFQNTNIQRGLIWNVENVISRGVQANLTLGSLALSGALTDGFYTKDYKYLTGLASYTINDNNSISIAAGGNPSGTKQSDIDNKLGTTAIFANSQQYNLYYKNVTGPWTFQPILQYTKVNKDTGDNVSVSGHTAGGSLIVNYDFNENYSLAARGEYIKQTGSADFLGYGTGSKAYTFTLTPTYKQKTFFARADLSYVKISDGDKSSGLIFGANGTDENQVRAIGEVGFLF